MDAMTIPDVWSGQDGALTAADMENMPDDEFRYELVEVASPRTCSGSYEQAAHITGAEEHRAAFPFPVTITPSQLVTAG